MNWLNATGFESASATPLPKNKEHTPSEVAITFLVVFVVSCTFTRRNTCGFFSHRDRTGRGQSVKSRPARQGGSQS